ncbi:hypothetical protein [Mycoplasma sp. P36-A1]|uniref:hypothetical protein n=1 Tax=Mycoplasma sp. P36-A1 TaxID=3252900 RepID=UPI003C2EB943
MNINLKRMIAILISLMVFSTLVQLVVQIDIKYYLFIVCSITYTTYSICMFSINKFNQEWFKTNALKLMLTSLAFISISAFNMLMVNQYSINFLGIISTVSVSFVIFRLLNVFQKLIK